MSPAGWRAVAFDLDGTLVDSRRDLAAAVNLVRADLGLGALPLDDIVSMVGEGARKLMERALGPDFEQIGADAAVARFLARYEPICTRETVSYPGVAELLAELAGTFPLGVLTNKPERPARLILEHLGWSAWFRAVVGGDTLAERKPGPQGLLELATRFGVAPGELLLVGDSRIDADTAAAAGAPFLFVEWGFGLGKDSCPEVRLRARDAGELRARLCPAAAAPADAPQ
jgi:phosphoglycolate phosphatase